MWCPEPVTIHTSRTWFAHQMIVGRDSLASNTSSPGAFFIISAIEGQEFSGATTSSGSRDTSPGCR